MNSARFEEMIIPTMGFEPTATPTLVRYKDQVLTYPYVPLEPTGETDSNQPYEAVVLENDSLKVVILPELGGRVYSVLDKKSNEELFYRNPEILMRYIAPRDAWFAGGIEFNFPVGHALHTSTPVNVKLVQNPTSVAAILSNKDRVTGLEWSAEIILHDDSNAVEQVVTLQNSTYLSQPFNYWVNAAVPVSSETLFIYPCNSVTSDEYEGIMSWPHYKGRDLRDYTQVDRPSSFFALNPQDDYFGVYYPERSVGVLHFARRIDLPGTKLFTWGSNGDGNLWYRLLCADGVPYAEIQAGIPQDQGERALMPPFSRFVITEWWVPFHSLADEVISPITGETVKLSNYVNGSGNAQHTEPVLPAHRKSSGSLWDKYLEAYQQETRFNYWDPSNLLHSLLEEQPDFAPARVALARILVKQGLLSSVADVVRPLLEQLPRYEPTRLDAVYLDALSKFGAASVDAILESVSTLAMSPLFKSGSVLLLSEALVREERFPEAKRLLEDSIQKDALSPVAASKAVVLLWRLSNHDDAILDKYSARVSKNDTILISFEGEIFGVSLRANDHVKVTTEQLLQLGCEYHRLGLYNDLVDVVLRFCPQSPSFQYLMADAFERLGKIEEKDRILSELRTLGGDFPWELPVVQAVENSIRVGGGTGHNTGVHHYFLGHYYEAVGRLSDAANEYLYAAAELSEEDDKKYIFTRQAAVRDKLGDARKARYYAERAISMSGQMDAHAAVELDSLATRLGIKVRHEIYKTQKSWNPELRARQLDVLLDSANFTGAIHMIENSELHFHEGVFWPRAYFLKAYILKALDALKNKDYSTAIKALATGKEYPASFGIGRSEGLHHLEQLDYITALTYQQMGRQGDATAFYNNVLNGTTPVTSELFFYKLSAAKILGRPIECGVDDWVNAVNRSNSPDTKKALVAALRDVLNDRHGAKQRVRSVVDLESDIKENWWHQLANMNQLIPENRIAPVIWEAFYLETK